MKPVTCEGCRNLGVSDNTLSGEKEYLCLHSSLKRDTMLPNEMDTPYWCPLDEPDLLEEK